MENLRLYQIPFSHFCDKVRWALDFYSIPYQTINYVGTQIPGLEKAPETLRKLSPIIEDPNNNSLFMSDSTPILLYLDEHYGNKKTLFPSNTNIEKDSIIQYCLKLDSQSGLYTRRLANLYWISENPAIVSVFADKNFDEELIKYMKKIFLKKTICVLEEIKENFNGKEYLFNNQFTAADLTLTALMEFLTLVTPLFIKNKSIFDYCDRIRERHYPRKWKDITPDRLFKQERQKRRSSQT